MNLTEHFSLAELTRSEYAIRHGISNIPTDADVLENLHTLAAGLERVRTVLRQPVHISSGYRSPKVNSGIGGSRTSAHMLGLAADIVLPGVSAREVCAKLAEAAAYIGFKTLIYEQEWTHIEFPDADDVNGKQRILTAIFKNGGVSYVNGLA